LLDWQLDQLAEEMRGIFGKGQVMREPKIQNVNHEEDMTGRSPHLDKWEV
jgi:hypothetical protein